MTISVSDGSTTLTLPVDLLWVDEFDWQSVEQSVERTLTGALIVDAATRTGGRPITLKPQDDSSAWMSRADLVALETWGATPGQTLTLMLRGVTRTVIFRHHDSGGMSAAPVVHYNTPGADDFYLATLKFLEI